MPALFLPADLGTMLVAIKTWVDAQIASGGALVGYAAAPYTVIWGEQDAGYPGHPYAVLRITTPPHDLGGQPAYSQLQTADTARTEYDSEFVVQLELLTRAPLAPTTGLNELMPIMSGLEASLRTRAQLELFGTAGLALVKTSPPLFIPVVDGFGFERRARIEIHFRARTRMDNATPALITAPPIGGTLAGNFTGNIGG